VTIEEAVRAHRLRTLRESMGLSQWELAIRVGVYQTAVVNWEKGTRFPQWENLRKLADIFGVSTDYLRTGNHDRRNSG